MPLPVDLMEQARGRYLSLFRDCFSLPQGQHLVSVLLALMPCEERRTLLAFLRNVIGVGQRVDGLARSLAGLISVAILGWISSLSRHLGTVTLAESSVWANRGQNWARGRDRREGW